MPEFFVIVCRATGAVIMLFLMTRILGKKQISQLTFFEYITGIAIGDLAGFMSTDIEGNYSHGIAALLVWFLLPLTVEIYSLKSKTLRNWLEGKGTVFISNGKVMEGNLRRERYTSDELMEQLRTKGVFNPRDVEFAMLEPTGELSVLLKEEHQPLTRRMLGMHPLRKLPPQAVIMDGNFMKEGMDLLGITREWLQSRVEKLGYNPDEIFLAVADSDGELYLDFYDDKMRAPMGGRRLSRKIKRNR